MCKNYFYCFSHFWDGWIKTGNFKRGEFDQISDMHFFFFPAKTKMFYNVYYSVFKTLKCVEFFYNLDGFIKKKIK